MQTAQRVRGTGMEPLLLYQMDMDGMASIWQMYLRFQHLSEPGTSWRSGEAHTSPLPVRVGQHAGQQQSTPSFLHTGN